MTDASSLLATSLNLRIKTHAVDFQGSSKMLISAQSRNVTDISNTWHQKYVQAAGATGSWSSARIKASPSNSSDDSCISQHCQDKRPENCWCHYVIILQWHLFIYSFIAFLLSASNQHTHLQRHSCLLV